MVNNLPNVTFDSTEIVNGTYVPKFVKHETIPERELALFSLTREDGEVLISEKYGVKHILVEGNLKANTQVALETQIDTFKELFSRKEKNLDISWAGGTRRYIATCAKHIFNRDYMHINFVPWVADFIVPAGVGVTGTYEDMYNSAVATDTGGGTAVVAIGSAKPKPFSVNLSFASTTGKGKRGIAFICGGKKFIYTQSAVFVDDEAVNINVRDKEVKFLTGGTWSVVSFHGELPDFILGNNAFTIEFGEILLEDNTLIGGSGVAIYADWELAQSFMIPWKDTSIMCLFLNIDKVSSPPDNLIVRIETDDGGKPSGTLAHANASMSIAPAGVPATGDKYYFTNPVTLEGNTRYWIVLNTTNGDGSNYYDWLKGIADTYIKGNAASSSDIGVTWVDDPDYDYAFGVYVGGKRTSNSSVSIYIQHYPRFL